MPSEVRLNRNRAEAPQDRLQVGCSVCDFSRRRYARSLHWGSNWIAAVCALSATAGLSGCEQADGNGNQAAEAIDIRRGDRVLVEPSAALFFEARVLEANQRQLRVQTGTGELKQVSSDDAYLLGRKAFPREGALVIGRDQVNQWQPCRVDEAGAKLLTLSCADGRTIIATRFDVVVPSGVTELNLRRHLDRLASRSEFRRSVEAAGAPLAPLDWRPRESEPVIAQRGSGWFSAVVAEVDDDGWRVVWDSDAQTTVMDPSKVIPMPRPGNKQQWGVGRFVLRRSEGPASPWEPVRIVAERGGVHVFEDARGLRGEARSKDLVALGVIANAPR